MYRILSFLILAASMWNCARIGQMRGPQERASFDRLTPPVLSGWSPRTINIAMLGHRGLYDDFLSIWLVQLVGDKDLKTYATAEQAYKLINSITQLQPKLESTYLLSCFVLALDYNRPDLCESISVNGLKAFPNSWRIPMTQGFIAAFKLGDYVKAAAFYGLAASRPQSPAWVQSLAKKMAEQGSKAGQDLNDTFNLLKEIPEGTKLLELLRPRLKDEVPHPLAIPPDLVPSPAPTDSNTPRAAGIGE